MKFHVSVGFLVVTSAFVNFRVEGFAPRIEPHRRASTGLTDSAVPTMVVRYASSKLHKVTVNCQEGHTNNLPEKFMNFGKLCSYALLLVSLSFGAMPALAVTADGGATSGANAKITTGGASTLQSGRTIAITRGVNLDFADFSNQNLKGVAFQQSIVRDANFKNSILVGASFFDATVDGSNFENTDLTQANFEMCQFNRASLKNAVVREAYVSGATLFEGIKDIEGTDWTDTYLRKDQQKYLCGHPTAKGTNPTTGVDTRQSLMCVD